MKTIQDALKVALDTSRPETLSPRQLSQDITLLVQYKMWGPRLAQLEYEQSIRYGCEMTDLIGSPAANRYY